MHYAVKPNIGGVDIGRGELSARPLGAASPAVLQLRSSLEFLYPFISAPGPPEAAGYKTRLSSATHPRPSPPERYTKLSKYEQKRKPEERRCSHVVIDPTQKNEALPPLSL